MKDPLFGDIRYELSWLGTCAWSIFGKTVNTSLVISCYEGEEIEPSQRQAYAEFEASKKSLSRLVEQAIFNYYMDILPEYRERFGEFADEWAPKIATVQEVGALVSPTEVFVQRSDSEPPERVLGLLFDCTWDTSLGLAVKLVNGKVAEVGVQDIVL